MSRGVDPVFKKGRQYNTQIILKEVEAALTDMIGFMAKAGDTGEAMDTYGPFVIMTLVGLFGKDEANQYLESRTNKLKAGTDDVESSFITGLIESITDDLIEFKAEAAKGEQHD